MRTRFSTALFAALCAVSVAAPFAVAAQDQATTDPASDLKIIRERAAQDPDLQQFLNGLVQMNSANQRPNRRELIVQQMTQGRFGRRGDLPFPVDIEMFAQLGPAAQRAQIVSGVLSADLDGDWQITQRELKVALKSPFNNYNLGGAAEAFVLGDTDGNGTLSTDEIRAYVAAKRDMWRGRDEMAGRMLGVFDLDGDGSLTEAEFNRALKALGV